MKRILAIILGVAAGIAITFMGDATTGVLSPGHAGLNYKDREMMRVFIEGIPMYVLVLMVIFWLASAFLGGMLAARINRPDWKNTSLITGGILFAAGILNLIMLPHPTWMWLAAVIGYLPAAFLGGWLVRPKYVPLP